MGYLIDSNFGLQKIDVFIPAASMQSLATTPYLILNERVGYEFVLTTAYMRFDGTTNYNQFDHAWIGTAGKYVNGDCVLATFGRYEANEFRVGAVSSFLVNINHGTFAVNVFGSTTDEQRLTLNLSMNIDDTSGDGNGYLTMYGYYVPNI